MLSIMIDSFLSGSKHQFVISGVLVRLNTIVFEGRALIAAG